MKIAGLDIGTTGCKLTVFDPTGKNLGNSYRDYSVKRGKNEHEIDVEAILESVLEVIKDMASQYQDIAGIGVTSFGETFVMTTEDGRPLHKAMLYTDHRGVEECRELTAKMDGKSIASITGLRPHEMYSLSKMMWIRKHCPDIYSRAKHIFMMQDYIVFALTGRAQIDHSLATRTMAFDITTLKWSGEMFRLAGIDMNLMSEPVPSGTSAGKIRRDISSLTGLAPDTQIITISHDQIAAAVGAGVFDTDKAVDGAGTVECLTPVYDSIPELDVMYEGNYAVVPYVIPGKYVCYAFSYTGGALIQWCVDTLAKKERESAISKGISVNALLESGVDEPTGMLVMPHFAGAATPYMDMDSQGAIIGLTMDTTVNEIYRSCMEGVVYEMMLNMECLEDSGIHFKMLHATGGGARSKVWMQMKADMLNIPITALKTIDAGTVGSAMLTGISMGCFSDLEDAAQHMVEKAEIYEPRPDMHCKYEKIYQRYRKMYKAVRPLM